MKTNRATLDRLFSDEDSSVSLQLLEQAALALGVIGFIVALLAVARKSNINFYIGLLAAASLVAMLIDLRSKAKSDRSLNSSDLDVSGAMKITVDGTASYYIAVILFIVAGILTLLRSKPKTR